MTYTAEHKVDTLANQERPGLVVDVTGSKWEWTFQYPAYGFSVRSGTVGRQVLVVPAGAAVRFRLISADVIHSFWVPALRYKHDLIPRSTQIATLTFPAGAFAGQCAEFCAWAGVIGSGSAGQGRASPVSVPEGVGCAGGITDRFWIRGRRARDRRPAGAPGA